MRSGKQAALAMVLGAALVGCGGGGDSRPEYRAVVSFGDSLSDVGTYAPVTGQAGGKFTINPGPVWVENIASRLGLAITPHIVGYGADSGTWQFCPRPACTGYAQGGARITDPDGSGKSDGALTLPLQSQIANHLAANGGQFQANELVLVFAGSNDVLSQFGRYAASAPVVGAGPAEESAVAAMVSAATEMVGYLKNDMIARGARQVTVVNLPSLSATPYARIEADASGRAVLDRLVDAFNATLKKGIDDNRLDVLVYDANAAFKTVADNPQRFGLVNTQDPACDPVRIAEATNGQVTSGSALFCNQSTLTDAARLDPRYQFADRLHPAPVMHRIFSDLMVEALSARGWL